MDWDREKYNKSRQEIKLHKQNRERENHEMILNTDMKEIMFGRKTRRRAELRRRAVWESSLVQEEPFMFRHGKLWLVLKWFVTLICWENKTIEKKEKKEHSGKHIFVFRN